MICSESRPSVSLEVNNAGKWLFFVCIAECLAYYFSVQDRDDGVAWASTLAVYFVSSSVFWSFHRMKIARIRLDIKEGEQEWSSGLTFFALATVSFVALSNVVDKTLHASLIRKKTEVIEYPSTVHILFGLSISCNFISYVYISRFGNIADDTYLDGASV